MSDGSLLSVVLADARNIERLKAHQIGADELEQFNRRDYKPSPSLATRIAQALGVDVRDLFPELGHRALHHVESDHERQL
jgi:DNA-binding XRE family transcriptional regulator